MAVQPWMHVDPLMSLLLKRGYGAEHSYEVVEAVAWRVEGGTPELQAITDVLGYVPHPIRAALERKAPHA